MKTCQSLATQVGTHERVILETHWVQNINPSTVSHGREWSISYSGDLKII